MIKMSTKNFQYWKELVGLEETDFPQLIEINETNIDRASIVLTRLDDIEKKIASNTLVDIQVQPGWGATTLFRVVKSELDKGDLNLVLSFDYEKNKLDGTMTEREFEFATKWKLAKGITEIMREKPLQQNYMYDVFDFEDNGSTPWVGYLRKKSRRLEQLKDNETEFYKEFAFFERMSIVDCVNYFLTNFQIQSIFMYLFPRRVNEDGLNELVGMIKNSYDGKDIAPAAMREVYVCTPKVFKQIKNVYTRPFFDIQYRRYSAAEIYGMLVSTYTNEDTVFTTVNDVFDEEFISLEYNEKLTMVKIMQNVTKRVEDCLVGDTSDIPFRLTASAKKEV